MTFWVDAQLSPVLPILDRLGPPPQIIWITCGNTSNARLRAVLSATLPEAFRLLDEGERLVEIKDA